MTSQEPAEEKEHSHLPTSPTVDVPHESSFLEAYTEVSIGPLPPPEVLHRYEEIVPGAANRILEMAENQSKHRMQLEKNDSRRSFFGLAAGFFLSLGMIGGAIYLIVKGEAWAAVSLIGINVAALAGVFVYGSRTLSNHQVRPPEPKDPYS